MPPRPQSSSQEVKTFGVIDQMNDVFDFVSQYYEKLYIYLSKNPPTVEDTNELHYLNSVFNELINKTMILYDEIAELGYVLTDLKPDNLVYRQEPDGSFKVFMIDFDPRFVVSPSTSIFNKMLKKVIEKRDKNIEIQIRANIMKYIFSTYIIINILGYASIKANDMMKLNIDGFKYIDSYARLRYPPKDKDPKTRTYIVNNLMDSIKFITNMDLMRMIRLMHSRNVGLLKSNAFNLYFKDAFQHDQTLLYNYCYLNYDELYNYTGINEPEHMHVKTLR
jgi:hypothetical protein